LGDSCLLDFYQPPPKVGLSFRFDLYFPIQGVSWTPENLEKLDVGSVWMERRSLLFLSDQMFTTMLHGIKAAEYDVITDRVFNRPEHLAIGSIVPRSLRYSLTSRFNGKHESVFICGCVAMSIGE
jgi:hypothetical protein